MPGRIPEPATTPPDIELTPIEQFGMSEIDGELSFQLTRMMGHNGVRGMLQSRNRLGTIDRYSHSQRKTAENLRKLRHQDALSAFVVHNSAGRMLGMATIMEDLPLREQYSRLPAWFARRWGDSPLVQSEALPNLNVSGWVVAGNINGTGVIAANQAVYKDLHRRAQGGSWTIESMGAHPYIRDAIKRAGYIALGEPARYDELETPGRPPRSQFYIAEESLKKA